MGDLREIRTRYKMVLTRYINVNGPVYKLAAEGQGRPPVVAARGPVNPAGER